MLWETWFSLPEDGPREFYFEGKEEFPSDRKGKEDWKEESTEYI